MTLSHVMQITLLLALVESPRVTQILKNNYQAQTVYRSQYSLLFHHNLYEHTKSFCEPMRCSNSSTTLLRTDSTNCIEQEPKPQCNHIQVESIIKEIRKIPSFIDTTLKEKKKKLPQFLRIISTSASYIFKKNPNKLHRFYSHLSLKIHNMNTRLMFSF